MLSGRLTKQNRFNKNFQSTVLVILITTLILIASVKAQKEGIYFKQSNAPLFLNNKK